MDRLSFTMKQIVMTILVLLIVILAGKLGPGVSILLGLFALVYLLRRRP